MKIDETKVRAMRAAVFGECSDANWAAVRDNWCRAEAMAWLFTHSFPLRFATPVIKP